MNSNVNNNCNNNAFSYNNANTTKCNNNCVSESSCDSDYFEIFGLKLHFDDILLICIIFFL